MKSIFTILISALFLLVGCTAQQPAQVKKSTLEPQRITPTKVVAKSSTKAVKAKTAKGRAKSVASSRWVVRSGRIHKTFSQSARRAGIPALHLQKLEALFAEQIDFRRDIQKGDRFTVVFQPGREGSLRDGVIMAAELENRGEPIRMIRHVNRYGVARYYRGDGEPLQADFLRSPLKKGRVSSHFTLRRYHPVLKTYRPHRGTDFAARKGTPVMATADGVVQKREYQKGYGKVIFLNHSGGKYTTVYAHLSKFGRGLKPGSRVRQGQLIGYVGSTGMSTGPHLHYEFRERGEYKDAMKVSLPRTRKLTAAERKHFFQATAELRKLLLSHKKDRQLAMAPRSR